MSDCTAEKPINNFHLKQIFAFFNNEENIFIAASHLDSLIFKGGVKVKYGSMFKPKNNESFRAHRGVFSNESNIEYFLAEALKWKRMFGWVPLKKVYNQSTCRIEATIPEFDSGKFFSVFNNVTMQTEVKFCPNQEEYNEDDYSVFVWDRFMPNHNDPFVRPLTGIANIYFRSEIIKTREIFDLKSQYRNLNPYYFAEKAIKEKDLSKATDEEIFQSNAPKETDPISQLFDRSVSTVESTFQSGLKVAEMNQGKTFSLNNVVLAGSYNGIATEAINNIIPLKDGYAIKPRQSNDLHVDFLAHKSDYEEKVYCVMGLTRNFAKSKNIKGDLSREQQVINDTVIKTRSDLQTFYNYVYNWLYRDSDNFFFDIKLKEINEAIDLLSHIIIEIYDKVKEREKKKREDTNIEITEAQFGDTLVVNDKEDGIKVDEKKVRDYTRIVAKILGSTKDEYKAIKEDIMEIQESINSLIELQHKYHKLMAKEERIELVFGSKLLAKIDDSYKIYEALDRGFITDLEAINLLRTSIGLELIDKNSIAYLNYLKVLKERKAMQAMEQNRAVNGKENKNAPNPKRKSDDNKDTKGSTESPNGNKKKKESQNETEESSNKKEED